MSPATSSLQVLYNPRRYVCRAAGLSHTTLPPFASCMCLSEDTQVEQLVKNSPASTRDVRDTVFIPGLGRSPGRRNGDPLQYSCLRIPWTEEPGGLQSTGSKELGMTEQLKHTHTLLSRFFSQCFLFLGVGDWTMGHTKSWFPDQGLNPCPLKWKCGVSTTGPPGQFRVRSFEGRLHLQCVHLRP